MNGKYGPLTAQDLHAMAVSSGAIDRCPWLELVDDEDEPIGDDWYVIVDVNDHEGTMRRRLDADLLWAAILACASGQIASVSNVVAANCRLMHDHGVHDVLDRSAEEVDKIMHTVMSVAVHGRDAGSSDPQSGPAGNYWYAVELRPGAAPATGDLGVKIGGQRLRAIELKLPVHKDGVASSSGIPLAVVERYAAARAAIEAVVAGMHDLPWGEYVVTVRGRESATRYLADIDEDWAFTLRQM